MSNVLNSEDFGLKIYNKFPPKYREDDATQDFALKRYLQALSDGGFKYSIDEINGITHLVDPDKASPEVLPVLFKQYGLDVFNGIPEEYLRYLLPKLSEAWSNKGSLSVVEFVTSSLSGIKTSTEVAYDDSGNPTVNIKLEMDYSFGDYLPKSEQFDRLLENFLPYYCDILILYSYLFYEEAILSGKEEDQIEIYDNIEDLGTLKCDDIGVNIEVIINRFTESSGVHINEESSFTISYPITYVQARLVDNSTYEDKFKTVSEESASFKLKTTPIEVDATFGRALFGKAVLKGFQYQDTHEDFVSEQCVEHGILKQPVDTFTNNMYNTLNGNFYTNSFSSCDIIKVGGNTKVVFN